jgi:alkanesulfonate monooxygenase
VWKRRLYAGQNGELADNGYWLLPFLTFQADCPYLVGSYAEIGAKLKEFAAKGLTTIMLDMVADETEMQHVCKALAASGMF